MSRTAGRWLALLVMIGALGSQAWAQVTPLPVPKITWHVENSFRFFSDAADTEVHRATFLALPPEDQLQHPILAAEQALSARHEDGWAETMFRDTCWDARNNRFACKAGGSYINPKSHRVSMKINGVDEAAGLSCTWLTAPLGGALRGDVVTQPCSEEAHFEIPYPAGSAVSVEIGGREVATEKVAVKDLLVVGMGDSFASGEGNPDVPVRFSRDRSADYGTRSADRDLTAYPARIGPWKQIGDKAFIQENARWLDQACHRSLYSHQLRAALQLSVEDPHRAVTFVGVGCSGAETVFGVFLRYKGHEWVPNPPEYSQISAVAEAQCAGRDAPDYELPEAYHIKGRIPELKGGLVLKKCDADHARKIDLLFLSVGGNDIGFARLVANAVLADSSMLRRLGGWFGHVHGFAEAGAQLDQLEDRLKAVNRAAHFLLHVPWPESDRVILTGYPPMALLEDGNSICPDGQAGMNVLPDFFLSEAKAREGNVAAERLHAVMQDSAKQHRWTLVQSHRAAFRGRGICVGHTDAPWTMADEMRLPRRINGTWEPYNPSEWRPYASRQRWFRTPNDAFMTGNFHVSQSLLQKVMKAQGFSWVQLLLASVYSGAFHPTAEGQAAIADAVVEKARGVLAKYDARRRATDSPGSGLVQ